jgi:hypothetical protein
LLLTRKEKIGSLPKVCNILFPPAYLTLVLGKRRYDRKQKGFGGQTKPIFRKKVKQTKKVTLK